MAAFCCALAAMAALYLCIDVSMREALEKAVSIGVTFSPLVAAMAVALFFGFFSLLNTRRGAAMRVPGAHWLGAVSYPLYLVHAHIGYMLLSRFATDDNKALVYPLVVTLVLGIALAIHLFVERAWARRWRALFTATVGAGLASLQRRSVG